MSGISLTASMRSNLLSLQNISGQVSSTQNKLATGNKVNSAIDNPSSYYTALSLNNRADDLNALLDSMGQAVSTIKAATTALESATEFLEQAKAVEQSMVMDDFYRATKAHVSTKDELLAAAQNAEIKYIIVENNIDMGDTQIVLSEGQSLVGRSYAENDASSVQISFSKTDGKSGIVCNNNTSVSNLKINYQNNSASHGQEAAAIFGQNKTGIKISNVDISFSSTATTVLNQPSAIGFSGASSATLSGNINVNTRDGVIMSINALYGATILFENANVYTSSNVWIQSGHMVVDEQSKIATESRVGFHDGSLDVYGKINCKNSFSTIFSNVQFTLHKGAEFNVEDNIWGQLVDGNQIVFEAGSLVGSQDKVYLINKEIAIDGAKKIEPDYFMGNQDFSLTDKKWDKVVEGAALEKVNAAKASRTEVATTKEYASNKKQISNILGQYDDLIKDASYKGVNLLQKEDLNITFNEDNTGALRIKGVDASAKALGIDANDMSTLDQAINQIRSISSELGSYYNIVTTRQDFTESLINVLTEGADKLTLADMNEESANMLALQTRQQLAINSLSLASQASQSILKLF